MQKLLPIPTIKHIPQYDQAEPLCNKMDKIFLEIQNDIIDLKNIFDPLACPARVLDIFAKFVNANCKTTDSEHTKRHKIRHAIANNKLFGTWEQIKRYIDEICGGNSRLVLNIPDDAWFLLGDGATCDNIAKPTWTVFGLTEQSEQENTYGILLSGDTLVWQKGIFYIDVDNDHLTQDEINVLYETLFSSTPIGMIIGVGYMIDTKFTPYFILGEIL